jgi:hypothetical protein
MLLLNRWRIIPRAWADSYVLPSNNFSTAPKLTYHQGLCRRPRNRRLQHLTRPTRSPECTQHPSRLRPGARRPHLHTPRSSRSIQQSRIPPLLPQLSRHVQQHRLHPVGKSARSSPQPDLRQSHPDSDPRSRRHAPIPIPRPSRRRNRAPKTQAGSCPTTATSIP